MTVNEREICLAIVEINDDCRSFLNRKAYIDFIEENTDVPTDIFVIFRGGEGAILDTQLVKQMEWIILE